jgi:hypothetical protein
VPGADQTLLLYDNKPASEPFQTRAVEFKYEIKPGAQEVLTAQQTWEYSPKPAVPSELMNNMGEVRRFDASHIVVVDTAINEIAFTDGMEEYDPDNHVKGRLTEVTYPGSTEVFQVELSAPEGMPFGFWLLGAERVTVYGPPPP